MVQHEGIEVYVVRFEDDERHQEYAILDSRRRPKADRVFIESVAGERLAIVAECLPSFNWKGAAELLFQFWIDDREFSEAQVLTRSEAKPAGILKRGRQVRHEEETWLLDDKWTDCELVFKDAEIDESSSATISQNVADVAMTERGVIGVQVTRGSRGVDDKDRMSKEDGEPGDLAMPNMFLMSSTAKGRAGKDINFFIHYRSRADLECLNIIPSSSTPRTAETITYTQDLGKNIEGAVAADSRSGDVNRHQSVKRQSSIPARDSLPRIKAKRESINEPKVEVKDNLRFLERERDENAKSNAFLASDQGQENDQSSTARISKQEPASIRIGDDDDIQIIHWRHVSPPQAPVEPKSSATAPADPADPERKKRLLKMRLEELRIERELMELE